jgi:hypothetical protein
MRKSPMRIIAVLLTIYFICANPCFAHEIKLSPEEISLIGERIFLSECSSRSERLIAWNKGEDFLSLGIGHFIWYPKGSAGPFEEAFPDFVRFAKLKGADMPSWVERDAASGCPWLSREEFLNRRRDNDFLQLKTFIQTTIPLQAEFIIERFNGKLPDMINALPEGQRRRHATRQIQRLISTPQGVYALVDYANFKGMGISHSETYNGYGWGLLQVIEGMRDETQAPSCLEEFVRSAGSVLDKRVENAPKERGEKKWLKGWHNRINGYIP